MIPTQIIIHHTASSFNTPIAEINRWHKFRGFPESSLGGFIGYHYVIDASGKLYQTRRDSEIGAHSPPNEGKIGIALIGNFMLTDPTIDQIDKLTELVNKLKSIYKINYVKGHRDCNPTDCPGDNLYKFALIDKISFLQRLINFLKNKIYPYV